MSNVAFLIILFIYLSENEDNSDDHHNHPAGIDHYPSADPRGANLPNNEHSIRYDMILIFFDHIFVLSYLIVRYACLRAIRINFI